MKKNISVIGVPMDLGQLRRGVDMGPSAIRYAGMYERLTSLGYQVNDLGNVHVEHANPSHLEVDKDDKSTLRNLQKVANANRQLAQMVDDTVAKADFPLVIGGDHSIAIGTLAGLHTHYKNLGVIWYDAHGDLNSEETSPSGNIHGMPLAASLGIGHEQLINIHEKGQKINPENLVIIGARCLDPGEKALIQEKGIRVYTMHEIDKLGMPQIIDETLNYLKERTDGIHLSLDLDGLDPSEAPGVGTPVIGGMTYRESHLAMEMLHESDLITSAEFVEVNPILDDQNKTADLAVGLMGSLFGEKLK